MFTTQSLGRNQYAPDMTSPQIRPAGVTTRIDETAAQALSWGERPPTPPEQRRYRQSLVHEPGKIIRHPGTANDQVPEGPFGDRTVSKPGESVSDYIKSFPTSEVGRWTLERSEDIYASSKREPLGKGYVRGHKIPEGMGTERPFGVVIDAKGKERFGQASHIIFPTDQPINTDDIDPKTHTLYVKSHHAYNPGEQRDRQYNWEATGVDPTQHRFGAVDKDNYREGVKKALQPNLDQTAPKPSLISSKLHEDYKLAATDFIGKTRKLGAGERSLPEDHVYGMPSLRHGPEPGVDELLHGSYPQEEQQPDADLGKSLREGWRNTQPEGRTFGVPSIRTDVPLPRFKSVANTTNFGNEPDALALLRPPKSVERGIHEEHYITLRPKDEIRELVAEAEIELPEDQFEAIFSMAAEADGEAERGRCCLDTFFRARHHVLAQTLTIRPPF